MKKKLGVLVLTLASLVITAACESTGDSSQPNGLKAKPHGVQPDSGENWAQVGPSERVIRPSDAAGVPTARLSTR